MSFILQDSDVSDDEEIENKDDESFSDEEVDFDTPLDYRHSLVHSLRADIIVAKGFSMSSRYFQTCTFS